MKHLLHLVNACLVLLVLGCAEKVEPNASAADKANAKRLVVSDIVISRGANTDSFRIVARITNQSEIPAINPVFHVSLDSSPLDVIECSSSMILMPLQSGVFCSGGLHASSPEILKKATTATLKLYNDPFSFAGWDQQLKVVPKLSFKDVTHRKFPTNQLVEVTATLQNDSGFSVAQVMATAVFLDQAGKISDAGPIIFNTKYAGPVTQIVGFPMADVKATDRCIIQIARFEEK